MWKGIFFLSIFFSILEAQNPSFMLTQKGSNKHNRLFLNPSSLSLYKEREGLEVKLVNAGVILSKDGYEFLDELSETTSSANKGKDIAVLLKNNIGNTITLSAHNFSSMQSNHQNFFWSLGVADTFNAYYIPHTGFGSKGALESSIEKYRVITGTFALTQQNFHYGINLKSIKKTIQNHNYSIQEMINAQDIKDYLRTNKGEDDTSLGVDAGLSYVHQSHFKPVFHLSLLDIGNTSFQNVETIPSTMNIGFSIEPYEATFLSLDYLDLFKSEAQQTFHQQLRVNLSHTLFDTLQLNSGLLNNALLYGMNYQRRYFHIGVHSYRTNYQHSERKYELSFKIKW
jgi:hypothetical protein